MLDSVNKTFPFNPQMFMLFYSKKLILILHFFMMSKNGKKQEKLNFLKELLIKEKILPSKLIISYKP